MTISTQCPECKSASTHPDSDGITNESDEMLASVGSLHPELYPEFACDDCGATWPNPLTGGDYA